MCQLYPLTFKQQFVEVVWGGHRLRPLKGLPPSEQPLGESWEVSAVEGRESVVENGSLAGQTLTQLAERFGEELLGHRVVERYGRRFPLLIKLIDAEQDLSIQVHPDDHLAWERHRSMGKTEMWFVMESSEQARLYSGFSSPISKYEYEKRVEDGSICDVLQCHEVKKGDVFFIPSGRIHAICGGTLVAEIQQSSDITYRIYDYNRPGLDGHPRQLHTELAKDAIDYKVYNSYLTNYQERVNKPVTLTECPYFTAKILTPTRPFHRKLFKYDSFVCYLCLEGDCRIENIADSSTSVTLPRGYSCLVPASVADIRVVPLHKQQTSKVLEVYIDNKT
mgnify:CR=1 FL=1